MLFPDKDNAEPRAQVSHEFGAGLIPNAHTFSKGSLGVLYAPFLPLCFLNTTTKNQLPRWK